MGAPLASRPLCARLSRRVAMSNAISSTYLNASIQLCLLRKLNLTSALYCCLYSPSTLLDGYMSASIRLVIKTKQLSRSRGCSTWAWSVP